MPAETLVREFYCQISPPVVQQFGQFVISVKNNKKIDAEKIKKFEFQVNISKQVLIRVSVNKSLIFADNRH